MLAPSRCKRSKYRRAYRPDEWLYWATVHLYILLSFLLASGICSVFGKEATTGARVGVILCIMLCVGYCAAKRWYAPAVIASASFVYGYFEVLNFSWHTTIPANFNAGFFLYCFGATAIIYPGLRMDANRIVRMLMGYGYAYVFAYFAILNTPALQSRWHSTELINTGHSSGLRISLSVVFVLLPLTVSIDRILALKWKAWDAVIAVVALLCILECDFRVATFTSVGCIVLYVGLRRFISQALIARIFATITFGGLAILAICYLANINPYFLFFSDESALARTNGFYLIRAFAQSDFFVGRGVQSEGVAFNWATSMGQKGLFWDSDYGVFGMFVWGGVVAIGLYTLIILLSFRFPQFLRQLGVPPSIARGYGLTGWTLSLFSASSPQYIVDGGSTLACIMIATALLARERSLRNRGSALKSRPGPLGPARIPHHESSRSRVGISATS